MSRAPADDDPQKRQQTEGSGAEREVCADREDAAERGICTDFDEAADRELLQKALRQEQEKHRRIIERTWEAFVSIDEDGLIADWNKRAEEMFGWTREDVVGSPLVETIIPERYRQAHLQGLRHYFATGEGPILNRRIEVSALHRDGHEFPVELSVTPIRLNDHIIFCAFLHDITERKEMAIQLERARDEALAASGFKSEFLANMSHEIRTPMNAVIGMAELLLRTQLSSEQRDYATVIHDSADALLDLINDILDYSKIEAGKLDLESVDFELLPLVEGAADILGERARKKRLSLMTYVSPVIPPVVQGDPGRVRQVLLNLISNGIKFTERGEVVVRVEPVSGHEPYIRFSVSDTGIGLDDGTITRLFHPFTQADYATARKYGGTGLGLSISKRLVELFGGEIGVDSQPAKGSVFWFTCPLPPGMESISAAPSRRSLGELRVLSVDGPQGTRQTLEAYVSSWGLRWSAVSGADEALALMKREAQANDRFDVVFVDSSAGMDSLNLPRRSAALPELSLTSFVLLSAEPETECEPRARECGFTAVLTKPVKQSRLFDCMANLTATAAPGGTEASAGTSPASLATHPELRTERILVVEDNRVNQKVALLLLRELGFSAELAADGLEAVEALSSNDYALVLMDCQMPELDGFEATRVIRRAEASGRRHTPIVAMTAHAMAGDKYRCLEAGMDDYISKPVTRHKLKSVLDKWVGDKTQES